MTMTLVTGAAGGQQGSTGRHVTELLLNQGIPVRAFVRTLDDRADRLRELGADVVAGDLRDIAQVEPALDDVDRVFFTYPVADGLLDATAAMAAAARKAGVRRLVEVSQLNPRSRSHSPRSRQHFLSEQVFDWAGVGAVHLRATVFYENVRVLAGIGVAGELAVPLGPETNTIPLVAGVDVARTAAALLAELDRPAEPFYRLVGEMPTIGEIVGAFGRDLRYRNVEETEWRAQVRDQGWDPHAVEHLSRLWQVFANAQDRDPAIFRLTDAVEQITGSKPETLREFLRKA
jgi:uncharacterized protein YbjT (DUF2867 family)